ncbi:MAG TPA: helix-hairpin-helix domain-containing protein, partial [Segetibacter sp.]
MTNSAIADNFSLLAKLIDIHGDDSFKAKSYSSAAFAIDKLPVQLTALSTEKIFALKGVGPAVGKKILEQIESGRLQILDEYILKTPPGVLELLKIKGLGPKKISTVWKELGIESMGELLYACEENRLLLYKGFGEKTQKNIEEAIQFFMDSKGSYLFSQVENFAAAFTARMVKNFVGKQFLITGDFNRHIEVIHKLEWVTDTSVDELQSFFAAGEYTVEVTDNIVLARG